MEIEVEWVAPKITLKLNMAEFALIYSAVRDADSEDVVDGVTNFEVFKKLRHESVERGLKLPKVEKHESDK